MIRCILSNYLICYLLPTFAFIHNLNDKLRCVRQRLNAAVARLVVHQETHTINTFLLLLAFKLCLIGRRSHMYWNENCKLQSQSYNSAIMLQNLAKIYVTISNSINVLKFRSKMAQKESCLELFCKLFLFKWDLFNYQRTHE